jgi:hypothetical protein
MVSKSGDGPQKERKVVNVYILHRSEQMFSQGQHSPPLPPARIDKIVNSAMGCKMMALLDCFLGYHQIWLHRADEEKTSFITPFGIYCYLRMPEGL